jgi:hypothetical protein
MDVKNMTLAEFLLARIAEAERKAHNWRRLRAGAWVEVQGSLGMCQEWREVGSSQWRPLTDEAREKIYEPVPPDPFIMAECEAKRRIVEFHSPSRHPLNLLADRRPDRYSQKKEDLGLVCEECSGHDDPYIDQEPWPCRTLAALALPYADHSDYREEWRP